VPAEVTTKPEPRTQAEVFGNAPAPRREEEDAIDLASVFGKLKDLKQKD
jgi:hypothetical protein